MIISMKLGCNESPVRDWLARLAPGYRRMYETHHTFACWTLAAGETPEWMARTLGHVNSQMVYKTYGDGTHV